jgi:hypothetical protein
MSIPHCCASRAHAQAFYTPHLPFFYFLPFLHFLHFLYFHGALLNVTFGIAAPAVARFQSMQDSTCTKIRKLTLSLRQQPWDDSQYRQVLHDPPAVEAPNGLAETA